MWGLLKRLTEQAVRRLLEMSTLHFALLFLAAAVLLSMMIVLTIDFLWDGSFNTELEVAGVITPFLDGLFLVVFINAMFTKIRNEVKLRKLAEETTRELNDELEAKVHQRTRLLQEAQEELVRREKLAVLGQVADTVGHELRNPLGVINNSVYYLQTVLDDADEATREYLGIIKDETANAERIVSDLLDAVRTKAPHPAIVNVAEAIGQTLGKCAIPASVSVSLDIPVALPAIRVDPMHLHQVFWNLVTNAVEAMPQGGTLEVRVTEEPQALRISVADSGNGMTAEQQARLFQPLFTTKARRVGLGLVVVKNLTQANGGSVTVASEPGKGSVFTVTLPSGSNSPLPQAGEGLGRGNGMR